MTLLPDLPQSAPRRPAHARMMTGGKARADEARRAQGDARRADGDFYATPPEATRALLAVEADAMRAAAASEGFDPYVWEPAVGAGHIADVLESGGFAVTGTDIIDRGWQGHERQGGFVAIDFLATPPLPASVSGVRCPPILTNPPFQLASGADGCAAFIRKALELGSPWVGMLTKANFWHAGKLRGPLFRDCPPSRIWVISWRLDFLDQGAPAMDCIWNVWDRAAPFGTGFDVLFRPAPENQGELI